MTDLHQVRRLRIRPGPGEAAAAAARALTEVAHRLLAAELDEALRGLVGDDADVEIAGLRVRLEVEPGETDGHTLAAQWAGLIRAEVVRALAATGSAAPRAPADDPAGAAGPSDVGTDSPAARAAALAAVLTGLLAGPTLGPADLRALAVRATDDAVTVEALARLRGARRRAALDLLHAAGVAPAAALLRTLEPTADTDTGTGTGVPPVDARDDAPAGRAHVTERRLTVDGAPDSGPSPTRTDSAHQAPEPRDEAGPAVSSYGGLVLLHHRLRPVLEQATDAAPGHDAVAVRLDVLAALARPDPDPDDLRPVREDPLVRLLAGDPGWSDGPAPPPCDAQVDQRAADDVLRSFAADLPGFATSTPDFVRFHWIDRRAFLVADHDAVLLRLGRRPLDLVLDRLPYPIGALRLPWTPTLLVGWEGP